MTETFLKLKKQYLTIALVKSLIVGVFCALFAVGTVMLGIKLGGTRLAWYFYLVIAVGTFALSFVGTFLLTRRSDKVLAKMFDTEYGLNEKVQTMVEFSADDGYIVKIQREDAEETLKNLPKRKVQFSKIWQYIFVVVLGLSFFLAGVIVPSSYVAPVAPDEYVLNEWDLKSLEQLISEVKSSDLEERVMVPVVSALEVLKEELPEVRTNSAMRTAVRNTAKAIDEAIILANSYRDVIVAINAYSALKDFKSALINATASYKSDKKITSMNDVKTAQKVSEEEIRESLGAFTDAFVEKAKKQTEKVEIKNVVDAFVTPLNESMSTDEVIELLGEDDLYMALSDLSSALGVVVDEYMWREDLKTIVSKACTDFVTSVSEELVVQVYNCMMDDMIFYVLGQTFGVSLSQQDLELSGVGEDDSIGEDDGSHSGGMGDNETVYGGTDAVYDYKNSEHVPYGKIWNDYVGELYEKLGEQSDLSEEMKAYIQKYIEILDGSSSSENDD